MTKSSNNNSASITFLLGTPTAGKSTICNETIRQSEDDPNLRGKVEAWGYDQESLMRCLTRLA